MIREVAQRWVKKYDLVVMEVKDVKVAWWPKIKEVATLKLVIGIRLGSNWKVGNNLQGGGMGKGRC